MKLNLANVKEDIYYIGVNDRKTHLFENMWPLDQGVSYNSYFVKGEKNIVLDLVSALKLDEFLDNIKTLIGDEKIDYVVLNHMEPDHSGSITNFIKIYPEAKVIGNKKTFEFLKELYNIELGDKAIEVTDGQSLELGNRHFTFYTTPMVHWPESMVSYEKTTKTLFSQDIFGSFGVLSGGIFDDETNFDFFEYEIRRYYSNIVGKYSSQAQRAIQKLAPLEIETICPVHGIVWRKNPGKIVEFYDKLSSYETVEGCVIVFGSMYGHTEETAEQLARFLSLEGIKDIKVYDISKTHPSYVLADIWKYNGLALGSCAYNNGLYPPMENFMNILASNKLKNHVLGVFGTYGWSGGGASTLAKLPEMGGNYDFVEDIVDARFSAKEADLVKLQALAKELAKRIKG